MNNINKKHIFFAVAAILLLLCGFFIGKGVYDRPLKESVTRDTVWLHDTIPDIAPHARDSIITKWKTKWMPVYNTVEKPIYIDNVVHDSILVQVPITSKHYGGENYDAYVSGFEPKLDSIFVYQKTQVITNTIIKEKLPAPLSLSVQAGADYFTDQKELYPYVKGNLEYNINHSRLSLGVNGGVFKADKIEPYGGAYMKLKIF